MTSRNGGRWAVGLGALLALALAGAPARSQEECATCHEEVAKRFPQSAHGRSFSVDKSYKAASCTSCHSEGKAHIKSSGEAKIANPAKGKAPESNAACLSCHEKGKHQAHWEGSPHEEAGVKCASCHSVHESHVTAANPQGVSAATEKCLECHASLRKGLNQRSHHPLRGGKMNCSSCHDAHGGTGEKLIRAGSVNDLCFSCHQEKRGPFLWEHSPVREDCLTCHTPHGSNHPTMLTARITQLCQSCHQQGRHQTLPGVPQAVWNTNKQCVNCHAQIHGSNHPSGPLFHR